jgi:hypothetical protein
MEFEEELTVESLSEDHTLVLSHAIPQNADAQLLKAARAAAVACQLETQLEHPDSPDLKKLEFILTDIRTRLGEPEPQGIPLDRETEATLEKLEKDWKPQPHKPHDRGRGR